MTTDETPIPNEYYEQLIPLIRAVESLRESTAFEHDLSAEERHTVRRLLHTTKRPLEEAREILPGPEPGAETNYQREPDEFDDYEDALTQIERRLGRLLQCARNEHPDEYRYSDSPEDKFETALESITAVRDLLPDVDDESEVTTDFDDIRTDAGYDHVDGRGHGDGRWLEYQLQRALRRWGYRAETRQTLFSLEIDVVALREEKQQEPTDWIVAQCKDWQSGTITPGTIFRLCTVAFACRAMPVLCHTTELTTRAEELARQLEVRVLELEDLERGELPAPKVAKPAADLHEWDLQYRVRENRGDFPWLLRREPGKHFSYVPGFEPVGKDCEYEPIDDDDIEDDTHPAAGH
ncbi:restriction endonuclease [Natrialba swarupiae]|uniref:restriction endonuclease n=1 Tax=Natrialba swarupiae TaxID=2448032 RepID=UPI001EE3F8AB|nr:restriction endonuclease [Natrialba swarupiae]